MSGKYRGVQAQIQRKNDLAIYIPCASHCLNLAGVHSASANVEMKKFFDFVESIFKFFFPFYFTMDNLDGDFESFIEDGHRKRMQ